MTLKQAQKLAAQSPEHDARLRLAFWNIQETLLAAAAIARNHARSLEQQALDADRILEAIPTTMITKPLDDCRKMFE